MCNIQQLVDTLHCGWLKNNMYLPLIINIWVTWFKFKSAINDGFSRAFVTIFDANVTTLIASLVLYTIGTGPVKGFAITLSIGIVTSMFTAILVTRSIVNLIYGGKNIKELKV